MNTIISAGRSAYEKKMTLADMKKITLQFPSLLELIDFEMVALEVHSFEVNRNDKTITAFFSKTEVAEALLSHKASVLEKRL